MEWSELATVTSLGEHSMPSIGVSRSVAKRIFLVADFGGQCAGEILFVEPRLSWNFEEKGAGEAAGDVGTGVAVTMRMREGCAGGGKGPLISEDKSLDSCNNDQAGVC